MAAEAGDVSRERTRGNTDRVEKVRVHLCPRFEMDYSNDVALIFIETPFESSPTVKMIVLGSDEGLKVGEECQVMGWGNTEISWKNQVTSKQTTTLKHGKLQVTRSTKHSVVFENLKRTARDRTRSTGIPGARWCSRTPTETTSGDVGEKPQEAQVFQRSETLEKRWKRKCEV